MQWKKWFTVLLAALVMAQAVLPVAAFAEEAIIAVEDAQPAPEPEPAPKDAESAPEPEPASEPEPVSEPEPSVAVEPITADPGEVAPIPDDKAAQTYQVTFVDGVTGNVLDSVAVVPGGTAQAPTPPDHEGHNFTGWSRDLTNISENTTITALYSAISYTVRFFDLLGETLASYLVEYDQLAAPVPTPPKIENKRFTGWSPDPATEHIRQNTDFQAVYEDATTYLVEFVAVYGDQTKLIASQYVAENDYANVPTLPSIAGYKFARWAVDPATTPITANTTFEAVYEETEIEQVALLTIEDKALTLNKAATLSVYYSEIIASVLYQFGDHTVTATTVQAYLNGTATDLPAATVIDIEGVLDDMKSYVKSMTLVCDKSVFQKNANVSGKKNGQLTKFVFKTPKARKSVPGDDVVLVQMVIGDDAYMHKWVRHNVANVDLWVPVTLSKAASGGGSGGGGGGGSSSTPNPQARLLIESVHTEPAEPNAGDTFDIVLNLRNTSSKLYLQNLELSYTAEEDAFIPVSGAGIEYIQRIPADSTYTQRLRVKSKPDIENSQVKLDVSVNFEDKQLNALSASQTVNISIKQVQRIELDEPEVPSSNPTVGDSYEMEMGVFNLGKTILYNVTARVIAKDENVAAGQSFYIGNMDGGTSKVVELDCTPLKEGEHAIELQVTYETVDGYQTTVTKPVTFTADAEEIYDYSDDEFDYEDTEPVTTSVDALTVMKALPWWLYAAFAALLSLLFIMIGMRARRRRKRAFEDDEME